MPTPDQENWMTLQQVGKSVGYGKMKVELMFSNGFLIGWEEIEIKRAHRAALKPEKEDDES